MQLQNETIKERTPIKGLLIDWLIIFGTYLFIRVFFALFGLHQNIVILGCCLAVLPYLLGAVYLQKSHKQCPLWLSASAILIPSIVEKIAIYLFGAYLYNLSPINVLGVMEAIKSNASYTNFIKNQSAQNLINLSYLNWTYILCSIAISVLRRHLWYCNIWRILCKFFPLSFIKQKYQLFSNLSAGFRYIKYS